MNDTDVERETSTLIPWVQLAMKEVNNADEDCSKIDVKLSKKKITSPDGLICFIIIISSSRL